MNVDDEINDLSDSDEDRFFGTDNQDNKTWLVKIPTFLAERWKSVEEPGVELGKLRIYKKPVPDPSKPGQYMTKVTLHVDNEAGTDKKPIPQNYNLTITNMASTNQYIFTESSQGKAVELAGKIEHEGAVGPVVDDDYRRIMLERTRLAEEKSASRVVKVITDKKSGVGSLVATRATIWDKQAKKKIVLDKRERMDKKDLLDLIFQLFEEKSNYTITALGDKTKQPMVWLKEVLQEVCILNKRGPLAGRYELKPEFKQSTPSTVDNN